MEEIEEDGLQEGEGGGEEESICMTHNSTRIIG